MKDGPREPMKTTKLVQRIIFLFQIIAFSNFYFLHFSALEMGDQKTQIGNW